MIARRDPRQLEPYGAALRAAGHQVDTAQGADEILERVRGWPFDLLVLDPELTPAGCGSFVREVKRICPPLLVAVTGQGSPASSVIEAFRGGACDYLLEPVEPPTLLQLASRAVELRRRGEQRRRVSEELEQERLRTMALERRLGAADPFAKIVGVSQVVGDLVDTLREIARTDSTVLLTGESGTGKGLAARAIHEASARRHGPYVEANCVVYSEGVLHSELFGHERGSFTGADRRKKGRFELAQGGTLLLDEIGEISPATQLLLLRVLQERIYERVGGEQTLEADVRLISATNKDLEQAIRHGRFREDLYYRLNVIPLRVPALRARAEDIPVLAQYFLRQCSERMGRRVERFTDDALGALMRYPWPGNIRELENLVERLVVLCRGEWVELDDLPPAMRRTGSGPAGGLPGTLKEMERQRIREALREAGGNKKRAAARLGIHRSTLYAKLYKYGLLESGEEESGRAAAAPSAKEATGR